MAMASNTTARILADLTQRAATQSAPAASKVNPDDLDWQDYDPAELPGDIKSMYDNRREAMILARELEKKFEDAFNDRLRQHKLMAKDETMLVSYRYGKFRCAVVKTASIERKTAKPTAVFGFNRG